MVHVMSENAKVHAMSEKGVPGNHSVLFQKSEASTSKSRVRSRLRLDSSSNALRRCSQLRVALQHRDIKQTYLPREDGCYTVQQHCTTLLQLRAAHLSRCSRPVMSVLHLLPALFLLRQVQLLRQAGDLSLQLLHLDSVHPPCSKRVSPATTATTHSLPLPVHPGASLGFGPESA